MLEATRNWPFMYDLLNEHVQQVDLVHAKGVRGLFATLVETDHFLGIEDMPLHGIEQILFGDARFEVHLLIQREEFKEVPVRAAWRAGPTVTNLLPAVAALFHTAGQVALLLNFFFQMVLACRDVEYDPMHPGA